MKAADAIEGEQARPPSGRLAASRPSRSRQTAQRFGAITAARVVSLCATLIQLPLLTGALTPSQYAVVAAAIASAIYVSFASVEPAALAFQRFPGSQSSKDAYAWAQRRLLVAAPVACMATILFGLATDAVGVCVAAAGWGLGLAWMRLVSTAWLMWDAPWRYALASMVSTVLRTAALCLLVTVEVRPDIAVGAAGLLSALAAIAVRPRVRGVTKAAIDAPRWFGLSLAVSSLAVGALTGIDKVLIPLLVDSHAAGRYSAMSNLSAYSLGAFFGILTAAVFPALLRSWEAQEHQAVLKQLRSTTIFSLWLSVVSASVVFLWGETVLAAVLGPAYVDVAILGAMLIGAGLFTAGQLAANLFQFRLATRSLQYRSWTGALATIAFVCLGAFTAGAAGAAAGLLIGMTTYAVVIQWSSGIGVAVQSTSLISSGIGLLLVWGDAGTIPGLLGLTLSGGWLLVWGLRRLQGGRAAITTQRQVPRQ